MVTEAGLVDVAEFDRAPASEAAGLLRPSCASAQWIGRLVDGRPYGSLAALTAASDAVVATLTWPDITEALAAHPRIGGQAPPGGREAAWSQQEQAGAAAGPGITARLRAGNAEYEERFGHVFLICATGRSAPEMLAALHGRLGHDPVTEREVVRGELLRIVQLRLAKTFR
jgi:2-oxo-4-hydroxy-4-carboxy-5-ureidoimidazoline decarboxylase